MQPFRVNESSTKTPVLSSRWFDGFFLHSVVEATKMIQARGKAWFGAAAIAVTLALTLTLLGGCADTSVGQKVSYKALCDPSNHGKRLALEGYFSVDGDIVIGRGDVSVNLSEGVKGGGETASFYLPTGVGNNAVKFPSGSTYALSDIRIVTSDGSKVKFNDRIRVSGTVEVNKNFPAINGRYACWMNQARVDKLK
jgi:hypothetical protein